MGLDLSGDVVDLLRSLVDVESVSGNEDRLATLVHEALAELGHLDVQRIGNAVVARTHLGRAERVLLVGHLDTVPVAGNLPSWTTGEGDDLLVHGRGSCDMKAGVAVFLAVAARLTAPRRDITWVFYDNEEVELERNGLRPLVADHPELLAGDFAILGEPTSAGIEGGCQGTLRGEITLTGTAAHSARSWSGHNAIHDAAPILQILSDHHSEEIVVDGLTYREGLNAVFIDGGIAGNVIPDRCTIRINYRFAPDKTLDEAISRFRGWFGQWEMDIVDAAAAARPGLDLPLAAEFVEAVGWQPRPKYGWTDVAQLSQLGVPAVNFGPGDPIKAHTDDEFCPAVDVHTALDALLRWLS